MSKLTRTVHSQRKFAGQALPKPNELPIRSRLGTYRGPKQLHLRKRPGMHSKVDQNGRQLLEADLEEMLQVTLKQGEPLKQAGGVRGASRPSLGCSSASGGPEKTDRYE